MLPSLNEKSEEMETDMANQITEGLVEYVEPPVDTSDEEDEIFFEEIEQPIDQISLEKVDNNEIAIENDNTTQQSIVGRSLVKGILDSIRRFAKSIAKNQSYF